MLREQGNLLRAYRVLAGRTQQDVADAVGCSATHISMIERGYARPSSEQLAAISKAINLPALPDWFEPPQRGRK